MTQNDLEQFKEIIDLVLENRLRNMENNIGMILDSVKTISETANKALNKTNVNDQKIKGIKENWVIVFALLTLFLSVITIILNIVF